MTMWLWRHELQGGVLYLFRNLHVVFNVRVYLSITLRITFDINDGQFAAISEARIDAENDLASTRRSQKQVLEILPENLVGAVGGVHGWERGIKGSNFGKEITRARRAFNNSAKIVLAVYTRDKTS